MLTHLLTAEHDRRIAVIMNEFGEISIDSDLVQDFVDEGILEMKNGCICCEIREDLESGITQLLAKRRTGKVNFDHIVMETTGLANPGPIAQTLGEGVLKQLVQLDGIITVVDAFHALKQLDDHQEPQDQIGIADVIILNKSDLVDPQQLITLQNRLLRMNSQANIETVVNCEVEPGPLLSLRSHSLDKLARTSPTTPLRQNHVGHVHLDGVTSFSIELREPLSRDRLMDWITFFIIGYSDRLSSIRVLVGSALSIC